MSLDHLWAGWRSSYIDAFVADGEAGGANAPRPVPDGEGSMFERILQLDDETGCIVHRGPRCSALLNAYPYTNGHLMVLPNRAVATLDGLDDDEQIELWATVRTAVGALERAFHCHGVNVGLNLGRAAGAGVPEHLHVHVLPRWDGDTNFMTSVADARVLPESLHSTWRKLRDAWA